MLDEEHPREGELVRGVNAFMSVAAEIDSYERTLLTEASAAPPPVGRLGGAS